MLFNKLSVSQSAVRMRITPRVKSSPTSWRWWSSQMLFCRGEFTCRTHLEALHKSTALLELSLGSSPCSFTFSFSPLSLSLILQCLPTRQGLLSPTELEVDQECDGWTGCRTLRPAHLRGKDLVWVLQLDLKSERPVTDRNPE